MPWIQPVRACGFQAATRALPGAASMPESRVLCFLLFMADFQKILLTTRHCHDIELSNDIKI
jgi:hypothetical protein